MFVTYRDPNLAESYKVYDEAADYVANFDADDRDMKKYIIGTIGNMDIPMEAVEDRSRSSERQRSGIILHTGRYQSVSTDR